MKHTRAQRGHVDHEMAQVLAPRAAVIGTVEGRRTCFCLQAELVQDVLTADTHDVQHLLIVREHRELGIAAL